MSKYHAAEFELTGQRRDNVMGRFLWCHLSEKKYGWNEVPVERRDTLIREAKEKKYSFAICHICDGYVSLVDDGKGELYEAYDGCEEPPSLIYR